MLQKYQLQLFDPNRREIHFNEIRVFSQEQMPMMWTKSQNKDGIQL